MRVVLLALMFAAFMSGTAGAYSIFSPAGKTLKVHWAVLEAKPGKMGEMAAISARTVAKYTPNEAGSYALYGGLDAKKPDVMRLLEIYEDEAAYQVHRDSEGFKAFITEREPILEKLTILPVDPIVLEQKKEGTAKTVMMTLIVVKPESLEEFKQLITQEMSRAAAQEPGVLGLFATAERGERSNVIHVLALYLDDEAMKQYTASEKYQSYRKKADVMSQTREEFANLPANVKLSPKGLHLSPDGQELSIFPLGQPNTAYAQYFDGQSYLAPVSLEQVGIFNVTFEPGCRNHWHIHHAEKGGGQILICVAGRGWYQEWGKPAVEMKPGSVVNIPANVKHWHGAAKDSWFQHLAVEVGGEGTSNEWCEAVDPEDYAKLK